MKRKINVSFYQRQQEVKELIKDTEFVCSTADIWSINHKSFMGVTLHWINPKTLKRESVALSCRRFISPHTFDRIAAHLKEINDEYGITKKLVATCTDNARNFDKAFRLYGCVPVVDPDSDTDSDSSESSSSDVESSSNDFYTIDMPDLPNHIKCATHTLSLIAKRDSENVSDQIFKKMHSSALQKLHSLWNRISRSTKAAETVHRILGANLILPNDTRWNAEFDSISCILKHDANKLKEVMVSLRVTKLNVVDFLFIKEFHMVMKPIAMAIDILQGDDNYYGILFPTIYTVLEKLEEFREGCSYCLPLLLVLINSLKIRFSYLFDFDNVKCVPAIIATCVHPYFKLRWIPHDKKTPETIQHIQRLLIQEIKNLPESPDSSMDQSVIGNNKSCR